jgi:ring-1,2-phenylacetyl-CoA epoxidase subunit PaaE
MVLTLTVRDVAPAAARALTVRVDLAGADFPYRCGQAVEIGRPGGARKPYSLATPPAEARARGELELLVGLEPSGAVPAWLAPLERGTALEVDGPHGTFMFPDDPAERRFLFVAGGTGIAPLRAMLYEAVARPRTASVSVLYSARTADDFAYGAELRALAAAGRITLWQTVTREVAAHWDGAKGRVALRYLRTMLHDEPTLCFVCGPHGLVSEASLLLAEAGVAPDRVRVEDWGG